MISAAEIRKKRGGKGGGGQCKLFSDSNYSKAFVFFCEYCALQKKNMETKQRRQNHTISVAFTQRLA